MLFRSSAQTLPYLNEWKMQGRADYIVGVEPCNVPCRPRSVLRESGMLQFLEPAETREMRLEIGILDGAAGIEAFASKVRDVLR